MIHHLCTIYFYTSNIRNINARNIYHLKLSLIKYELQYIRISSQMLNEALTTGYLKPNEMVLSQISIINRSTLKEIRGKNMIPGA